MFIPSRIVDWFGLNVENVHNLTAELAATRAERDTLKVQLITNQNNFNWLCLTVNSLQVEKAALLEKLYDIKVPVPELAVKSRATSSDMREFSFEDIGNDLAKKMNMPVYE